MNLEGIKTALTSQAARQLFLAKKHSPKILFVAGTAGVIGATILACKATLQVHDILDEHEKQEIKIGEIHSEAAEKNEADPVYLEKARSKQLGKLKVKTARDIAKLYLPAVGLGALAITALTGSHVILTKRNGAALAALATLDQAHKQYRQRVSETYGQDVDRKFALGQNELVVEEKKADGTVEHRTVSDGKTGGGSPYAVLFAEGRTHKFSREPGMNPHIITMLQTQANDKMRANGHLFLNEALDILGLPRTKAGQFVGWKYRSDDEMQKRRAKGLPVGDNYVSFGIFDNDPEVAMDFIDGRENEVWLDFNVDGPIYDEI